VPDPCWGATCHKVRVMTDVCVCVCVCVCERSSLACALAKPLMKLWSTLCKNKRKKKPRRQ